METLSRNNQFQVYQNNAVNTASGEKLTMMLYNGCIKFINKALQDMENNDYEAKNNHIQRAQDIIQELMLTLDQDVEISKQILPLYEYIYFQLQEGNINNNKEHVQEALNYVVEFRDTWKEVILKANKNQYTQGAKV